MSRFSIVGVLAAVAAVSACGPSQKRASSPELATAPASTSGSRLPVVPMDSATIYRLCAQPERVHAGWAECVLKDQSPPPQPIVRKSPPPP